MTNIRISAMGLQGNDLRLENLEVARRIAKQGDYDMMVLEDVTWCGIEPKWIQLSWRPDGENRKVVMKRVSGKNELEELSWLDMEQLMNE